MLWPSSKVELVQLSLSLSELMLSLSCRRCTCGSSSLSVLSPRIARRPLGVHDRMGVFGNGELLFVVLRCAAALPGVPCPRRVPLRRPVLDLCFDVRLPGSGLDCRLLGVIPLSLQSLSLDSDESSVIRCGEEVHRVLCGRSRPGRKRSSAKPAVHQVWVPKCTLLDDRHCPSIDRFIQQQQS